MRRLESGEYVGGPKVISFNEHNEPDWLSYVVLPRPVKSHGELK
jgi:hypothetical protein